MAYVKIIKTLRNFIIYPAIVFVVLGISLYVAPQTVAAISPPPPPEPEIYIEASLDENFFTQETQERVCLDQGCTFVLEPEQDSDAYYLKKAHEQGQKEELSLLGIVSLEEGSVLITPSSSQEEISLDEKALVEALDMLIENDISPIESDLLQTLERWTDSGADGGYFTVAHRESDKGQELQARKDLLISCYYPGYEQRGSWLITIGNQQRDYCSGGPMDHSNFALYLLTHIPELPVTYLTGLIFVLLGAVVFIYYLARKNELWFFLRPNKTKLIIVIISGAILTYLHIPYMHYFPYDVHLDFQELLYIFGAWVIDYLVEIYLLTCVIGYAMYRRRIKRTTN